MKYYFEFKENNSSKFWEIQHMSKSNPKKVIVNYGKIGSDGISKEFVYYNNT